LHKIDHVGVSPRVSLKLFGREIVFEEFQPYVITVPKRYERTDVQTDRQTTILWHYRSLRARSIARSEQLLYSLTLQ